MAGIGTGSRGSDAVLGVIEQLSGYALPASTFETIVLPLRVADYAPAMLDELTSSGEVYWVGGPIGDSDGWVRWYLADHEPCPARPDPANYRSQELLAALAGGGAYFFDALLPSGLTTADRSAYVAALWDLVWAGLVSGDTFAPVRTLGGGAHRRPTRGTPRTHRARLAGAGLSRAVRARVSSQPQRDGGHWSIVALRHQLTARRDRTHPARQIRGVTRKARSPKTPRAASARPPALSSLEEAGQCREGTSLRASVRRSSLTGAVDRLRSHQQEPEEARTLVLAACDPANPYGAALPWPERGGHRPVARPVPWSCSSAARSSSMSSAAASACCPSLRIRHDWVQRPGARPGGQAASSRQADGRARRWFPRLQLRAGE